MTTGRTPPPLQELTLSSGITVKIRKVSPYTLDLIRQQNPPPKPPMVDNDYGDGKIRREPNPDDPDHLLALGDHQRLLTDKLTRTMMRLGVSVDVDAAALDAFKADMDELGIALAGDDRELYIKHLVLATEEDITALVNAVTRKTMPTEEAVQEHLATFSGDVQGPGSDGNPAAPVGG